MFEVLFSPIVTIERNQERSFDEGEFQIVSLTIQDGTVNGTLEIVPLGTVLDTTLPVAEINLATISETNPYFAMVVRAIECDNSSDAMRTADRADFLNAIVSEAQAEMDLAPGSLPLVGTLWSVGNALELRDRRWRDDDDMIGVSARVYPNLGRIFSEPTIIRPTSGTSIPGSTQGTSMLFSRDGARWHMSQANIFGRWV